LALQHVNKTIEKILLDFIRKEHHYKLAFGGWWICKIMSSICW